VRRTDATTGGGDWRTAVVQRARAGGGCGNPLSSGILYAHAASVYHWVVRSVDCATFLLLSLFSSPGTLGS